MKATRNTVVLSAEDTEAVIKINKVLDLFDELIGTVESMSDKEFRMLEMSLELTEEKLKNDK